MVLLPGKPGKISPFTFIYHPEICLASQTPGWLKKKDR
jgi:hypothetical protein